MASDYLTYSNWCWAETGTWEITPGKSGSIRQPHWHRHLDVKRPNHGCGTTNEAVWFTSVVWRLLAHVDCWTLRR